MRKRSFVIFSLGLSAFLHFGIIFFCSLYIEAKGEPYFYGWLNIVNRKNLVSNKKEIIFPEGVNFSSYDIQKKYFFPLSSHYLENEQEYDLDSTFFETKKSFPLKEFRENKNYFYLWKREIIFSPREDNNISYKAFISSYGKILFLYPEKLSANFYGNLQLQEYLRNSVFFPRNRFFWTNLGGVVK